MSNPNAPLQENAIETIMEATVNWQNTMQQNQEVTATTVNQAATALMHMYNAANQSLSDVMNEIPSTKTANGGANTNYASEVQEWQTKYNLESQKWQNLENTWNTITQNGSTQESSLSNQINDASSMVPSILQPEQTTANLLASQL